MNQYIRIKPSIIFLISASLSIFLKPLNASHVNERFPPIFNLANLNGRNGFAINGTSAGSLGFSVSGAGDINGDGIPDMLFFGQDENNVNKAYVIFGNEKKWPSSIDVDSLNGSDGFVINALEGSDPIVARGVGDVNNDGIDDILIGDAWANDQVGRSYLIFGSKNPWSPSFNITDLNGQNGFVLNGINTSDFSGSFISGLGDINGDHIADFLIGTGIRGIDNVTNQLYVVFGNKGPLPASFNLADLDGTNGFTINNANSKDEGSYAIGGVGDINGDGLNDIVIGNPSANNYTGQSFIIFGNQEPWPAQFDLADLDGNNGFIINGINEEDLSGYAVSGVGDVNKDGLDDILIAAWWANKYGQIYVLFGSKAPWPRIMNLKDLNGFNGFAINGIPASGGYTINGAGDVNHDGYDDILIGAPWANKEIGQSFIVYGNLTFERALNLTNLSEYSGFMLNGIILGDWSGDSVSPAGDFNNDGIDDFCIGASQANNAAGQGYIVFGTVR